MSAATLTMPTKPHRNRLGDKPKSPPSPPVFGDWRSLRQRGDESIDLRRIVRAASIDVERTPMFRVVGEPEPCDLWELDLDNDFPEWLRQDDWAEPVIVDHDPARYAPYTDLIVLGDSSGIDPTYLLVEIV